MRLKAKVIGIKIYSMFCISLIPCKARANLNLRMIVIPLGYYFYRLG